MNTLLVKTRKVFKDVAQLTAHVYSHRSKTTELLFVGQGSHDKFPKDKHETHLKNRNDSAV